MLKGKAALVTGSTSGIGLGIARALATQGADLLLNGFGTAAQIREIRTALETEFRVRALHSDADLSRPEQAVAMVDRCVRELGRIDILVNNAGIQHVSPIEDFPPEKWDQVIAVNLSSNFHTIRSALPHMRTSNWGRIINIASVHGLVASTAKAAYVAAKHGVIGLTKVVALETAATGITCNAICPGWVLTPLVQAQIDVLAARGGLSTEEAGRKLLAEKQPSLAFATPEQIGGLAVFLCSPAADQMRGSVLSVDGGWAAQ